MTAVCFLMNYSLTAYKCFHSYFFVLTQKSNKKSQGKHEPLRAFFRPSPPQYLSCIIVLKSRVWLTLIFISIKT